MHRCSQNFANPPRCPRLSRGRVPIEHYFQRDKTDLSSDPMKAAAGQAFRITAAGQPLA